MKGVRVVIMPLLILVTLVFLSSCLHYYLPAGYRKRKPSSANDTILVNNFKFKVLLGERKKMDTMTLTTLLAFDDVPKERKLAVSNLKITVQDPRFENRDWHLQGIYMRRLDRHKTDFELKDSITGQALNDAYRFDLTEGDFYEIICNFKATHIKKHPSKVQVDVEGNLESAAGIKPFRKTILYTWRSGVELLH